MNLAFRTQYDAWMKNQIAASAGERRGRLREHGYPERRLPENVRWPAVGSFEHLHAEYGVADFRDGSRFPDFAYIRMPHKICVEADGSYDPAPRYRFTPMFQTVSPMPVNTSPTSGVSSAIRRSSAPLRSRKYDAG